MFLTTLESLLKALQFLFLLLGANSKLFKSYEAQKLAVQYQSSTRAQIGLFWPNWIKFKVIWTQPLHQSYDLNKIRWENNYFGPKHLLEDDLNSNFGEII